MGEGVSLKPPNKITEYSCLNGSTHAGIQGCNNERNFFLLKIYLYINLLIIYYINLGSREGRGKEGG